MSTLRQKKPLERKTPLRTRTSFARKASTEREAKPPKAKKCANRSCRQPFTPDPKQPFKTWCGEDCGTVLALEKLAKVKAAQIKAQRATARKERQELREKTKRRGDWMAEAQKAFNAYIRERDANQPCICCGKWFDSKDMVTGGQWDAGHYLSRGHAPHLRFDERNVHRQLKGHNRPGGTTRASFRQGMIDRIGLEAVLLLESDMTVRKWSADDLKSIRDTYRAKLKALKKERGVT